MKCTKCNTEYEGECCPNCKETQKNRTDEIKNKNQIRLLGFRTNKLWKKILSITYLVICGVFLLSILAESKYENMPTYDFMLEQITSVLIVVMMISPYVFLSYTKFRNILPLFKEHKIGMSILGMVLVILILGVVSGIIDSMHSDEFVADRSNHAYIEVSNVEPTCEKNGEIKHICDFCGTEKSKTLPAYGHDMKEVSHKKPTEKQAGEIVKECSKCGKQDITVLDKLKPETEAEITKKETEKETTNENKKPEQETKQESATTDKKEETTEKESQKDLTVYRGEYYSPSLLYGIKLELSSVSTLSCNLIYADGKCSYANITPGEQATLSDFGLITVNLLDSGDVHVELYSAISADGNFDETLRKGSIIDQVGLRSAEQLAYLDEDDLFKYLCEIEASCFDLDASQILRHPNNFCNEKIYRIPGKVTWAENGLFLLDISDKYENDTIICYSDWSVTEGSEVCVYGSGVGIGTYNKNRIEYKALEIKVGYMIMEDQMTWEGEIPEYMQDLIFGNYTLKYSGASNYYLGEDFTIDSTTIDGRAYTVNKVQYVCSYTPDWNNMDSLVSINLIVDTTDKRGNKLSIGFFFKLDRTECNCNIAKYTDGEVTDYDIESYIPMN